MINFRYSVCSNFVSMAFLVTRMLTHSDYLWRQLVTFPWNSLSRLPESCCDLSSRYTVHVTFNINNLFANMVIIMILCPVLHKCFAFSLFDTVRKQCSYKYLILVLQVDSEEKLAKTLSKEDANNNSGVIRCQSTDVSCLLIEVSINHTYVLKNFFVW